MQDRYISLIVCTIGREKELAELLQSLADQEYKYFEVILVDQNYHNRIEKIIDSFKDIITIKYINSTRIGLSYARNIGLKYTTGEIIGFPDDDCILFKSTLKLINEAFNIYNPDLLVIKEVNRKNFNYYDQNYKDVKKINYFNFMKYCNSIRVYVKKDAIENIKFDERFGVGSQFGSAEESDFIYNLLSRGKIGISISNIYVYHPEKVNLVSKGDLKRAYHYGLGMGAFFKKNLINNKRYSILLCLFFYYLLKPVLRMIKDIITLNILDLLYAYNTLYGRIVGFINFKKG